EVGSIIGKKGDHIKTIRDEVSSSIYETTILEKVHFQSMAKINISDSTSAERIVTITGSVHNITKAFTMICRKFEEDQSQAHIVATPPITFRLIIPANQCGSLIGKGGSKIKMIREVSANLQQNRFMIETLDYRSLNPGGWGADAKLNGAF
ncbi:unnamed protein product, partial [Soboliphyme baturini]|uniref:KH domain-containing protein n=1 Tax=Soboliphyme baturini TaxID=241478 RepID=A0A183J325_9BILA